jgi:hypothetical protein
MEYPYITARTRARVCELAEECFSDGSLMPGEISRIVRLENGLWCLYCHTT